MFCFLSFLWKYIFLSSKEARRRLIVCIRVRFVHLLSSLLSCNNCEATHTWGFYSVTEMFNFAKDAPRGHVQSLLYLSWPFARLWYELLRNIGVSVISDTTTPINSVYNFRVCTPILSKYPHNFDSNHRHKSNIEKVFGFLLSPNHRRIGHEIQKVLKIMVGYVWAEWCVWDNKPNN